LNRKIEKRMPFELIVVALLLWVPPLLMRGCPELSDWQRSREALRMVRNPNLEQLTPEQVLEYIEIFHLKADITSEQVLAGVGFTLTATDETADLLLRINYFTAGLHIELWGDPPVGSLFPLNRMSEEFLDAYLRALDARAKYTGFLTTHWGFRYPFMPFLHVKHVENFPAEMYWFYKNIPEMILLRIYVEIDGMPLMQYLALIEGYGLGWDEGFWLEYDGTGSLIKREDITDSRLTYLSDLFWNNPRYYREKEMMLEFGFSDENPMTFEWVISNPKEAYAIYTTTWTPTSSDIIMERTRYPDSSFFEDRNIPFLPPDFEPRR